MRALLLAVALAACASAADTSSLPTADPVIASERAFAARASEVGWLPAFREYVAPDAQLAQPTGYVNAPQQLAETPEDGNRNLFWWPAFAAISRSGDFGFTTGVVSFDEAHTPRGHYFTVWRRQADGSWKWIYDGGVGPIAQPALIEQSAAVVPTAATATSGEASAEAAVAAVTALEQAGGVAARLAPDALVLRSRQARATGEAALAAMSVPVADASYRVLRVEASAGGDLVMVLGEATWTADGHPVTSPYARMWQHRADGWRVLYDQLIIPRPAPPQG